MQRARRFLFVALGGLAVVLVAAVAAWAVDTRAHEGKVLRNTTLAGRSIGGLDQRHLAAAVEAISAKFATSTVDVKAPGGGFTAVSPEFGLGIDRAATVKAAMATGRTGSLPRRFAGWIHGFSTARTSPLRVSVDPAAVRAVVAAKDTGPRTPPVEPAVKPKSGGSGFTVDDGKKGKGIDPADLIAALPQAAAAGTEIVVHVERREVRPQYSKADADALVKRAEAATKKPVPVTAGSVSASVPVATLRSWVHSEPTPSGLHLVFDQKKSMTDLARILSKATTPPTQTSFVISGGTPQPKLGSAGTACCTDDAVTVLQQAVLDAPAPPTKPVNLALKTVPPTVTAAGVAKLGIKQQVSTFTTNYPAGQPRVTNIHRIADIVKGQIIMPGDTFSLNGSVGERTTAKGFVVDHEINDEGKFDEAVGGGVSQFATTTFNAAFFAGLDFGEYQSHTIYISRYPYGREATVSWQHPDLQIKNTTPYGVVLWASYTDTSLTVSMWSTPYLASVTQSAQSSGPFGPGCTRVKTERTRKYLDGRSVVDNVFATYQPSEGVKCR